MLQIWKRKPELYKKLTQLQTTFDLLPTHLVEHVLHKVNKMLAKQLREIQAMRQITEIRKGDGRITTDLSQIIKMFSNF